MGLWDLQAKLVRMLSLVSGVWLPALLLVPALFVYARMVFHVIKDLLHLGRPREQAPPALPRVVLHYEVKTRPGPVTRAARAFTAAQKCLSEQLQRAARVERANKERENAEKGCQMGLVENITRGNEDRKFETRKTMKTHVLSENDPRQASSNDKVRKPYQRFFLV